MTPEEAYEEALRRVRKAEETGALELDLSGQKEGKTGALEKTERLTSLRSLNLSNCEQLSGDLNPLAGLTLLHRLSRQPDDSS